MIDVDYISWHVPVIVVVERFYWYIKYFFVIWPISKEDTPTWYIPHADKKTSNILRLASYVDHSWYISVDVSYFV